MSVVTELRRRPLGKACMRGTLASSLLLLPAAVAAAQEARPEERSPLRATEPSRPDAPSAVEPAAPTVAADSAPVSLPALAVRAAAAPPRPAGAALTTAAGRVSDHLRAGREQEAVRIWKGALEREIAAGRAPSESELDGLVLLVLRRSYLEPQRDLRDRAEKVRERSGWDRELRRELEALRAEQARVPDERRAAVIVRRERQLAAAEEDARLASGELEDALRSRPRTLQAMSNVSRLLHEAAIAALRGTGG